LVEFLRGSAAARPEISRSVHAKTRRRPKLCIAMDPAWIIRSKDMGFDPELWKVRRELQRPLYAYTARRRKVEADDQNLHGSG
jgi:hypothetical protein